MIYETFRVLTCSNITCPAPPLWYEWLENVAAHGCIGAIIALLPGRTGRAFLWLLFVLKEIAFDYPNDPRPLVALDCLTDLVAMVSMTCVILWVFHHRAGKAPT